MIPDLLWRCPICRADDALRQKAGWWKPDRLWCRKCSVTWEGLSVPGRDYWLHVVGGQAAGAGQEASLTEWYDRMKSGLKLVAIPCPAMDLPAGEVLWAKSARVTLVQEIPIAAGRADLCVRYPHALGSG